MAAVDLSENDIDQLLSSAELSLASRQSDRAVAVNSKPDAVNNKANLTLAVKAPSPPTTSVGKPLTGNKHDLTLRVPQLKSKGKKVHPHIHFPPICPMMKSYPKFE